jgi:hypothetical protein
VTDTDHLLSVTFMMVMDALERRGRVCCRFRVRVGAVERVRLPVVCLAFWGWSSSSGQAWLFAATARFPLDLQVWSNPWRGVVASYTIGDVAERAGFTASALRFYEGIGLVVPVRPGHVVCEENGRWLGNQR